MILKGKREEVQEDFEEFKASLGSIVTLMPVKITVQSPVSKNKRNYMWVGAGRKESKVTGRLATNINTNILLNYCLKR